MSGTEGLTPSGVVLFDRHLGVTESDNLGLAALALHIDRRLLRPIRSSKGSVKSYFLSFVCCHYFLGFC